MVDIIIPEESNFCVFRIRSLAQMISGIVIFPFWKVVTKLRREKLNKTKQNKKNGGKPTPHCQRN